MGPLLPICFVNSLKYYSKTFHLSSSENDGEASQTKKRKVPFAESHISTKKRRISDIIEKNENDAIIKAAIKIFQNRGHKNAAKALEILEENPENFSELHEFVSEVEDKKDKSSKMTARQGLFHMLGRYLIILINSFFFNMYGKAL